MDAQFAGSKSIDDRRRRRLAQEADDGQHAPRRRRRSPATPRTRRRRIDTPHADVLPDLPAVADLSLALLIPKVVWKPVALAIALLFAGLLGPWAAPLLPPSSSWNQLLAGPEAPLFRAYDSAVLLGAAQLALLIYWVRSHSQRDFQGRYRTWLRVASATGLASLAIPLRLHQVLAESIVGTVPHLDAIVSTTTLWLAASLALAGVLAWQLHREMALCSSSRFALHAAVAVGAIWALGRAGLWPLDASAARLATVLFISHALLLLAFLLHARFVVHFNAEPPRNRRRSPPAPHTRLAGSRSRSTPRRRSRKSSAPSADARAEDDALSSSADIDSHEPPAEDLPDHDSESALDPSADLSDDSIADPDETPISTADSDWSSAESRYDRDGAGQRHAPSSRSATARFDQSHGSTPTASRQDQPSATRRDALPTSPDDELASESDLGDGDEAGDADGGGSDLGDLSGLSRKQRRKLLKQQRRQGR